MDLNQTRELMRRVAAAQPAWLEWRQNVLIAQANFEGEASLDFAARRMTELWRRNLEDVALDAALAVVDKLAVGQVASPPYGELPVWLRREALRLAPAKRPLHYAAAAAAPACAECRDTGWVAVFNPEFVARYRDQFARLASDCDDWWMQARRWWRAHGRNSPVESTVVCEACCVGAARPSHYPRRNPHTMPRAGSLLKRRAALAEWYASRPVAKEAETCP